MKPNRLNDLLLIVFFVGVFIQNATVSIGSVQIGSILVPIGFFVVQVLTHRLPIVRSTYFNPVLLFLGYVLLRMFTSPQFGEAVVVMVYFFIDALVMVGVYTLIFYALRNRRQRLVVRSISGVMLVTVLIYGFVFVTTDNQTLAQSLNRRHEEGLRAGASFFDPLTYVTLENQVMRLYGFYLDPNYWALYAFAGLFLITIMKMTERRTVESGWTYFAYLPPILSGVLTFSRGSLLGLFLLFLCIASYLLLFNPKQRLPVAGYVAAGVGLASLIVLPFLYDFEFLNKLLFEKTANDLVDSTMSRPFIWTTYLFIFSNWSVTNLLFGVGMSRLIHEQIGFFMPPHNFIFQLVATFGLVGMSLHLFMTGFLIRLLLISRRRFSGWSWLYTLCVMFFGVLLVMCLFLDTVYHLPYWMMLGAGIGLVRYSELQPILEK